MDNVTLETLHAMLRQTLDVREQHGQVLPDIGETIGRIECEVAALQRQFAAARRVMREEQE